MAINVRIATDIFRQKWFRELSCDHKVLWLFLMTESNLIGVFEIDSAMWNFICKPTREFTKDDAFRVFGKRVIRLPKHPDKGIVVGKLDYQRSFGRNSKQWVWVEKALAEADLTYEKLQELQSQEEQMELPLEVEKPVRKPKVIEERKIIPPQLEWVKAYCESRQNRVNAEQFCSFYESKGWKVGNNKMKDWQAAVRNWEQRDRNSNPVTPAVTTNEFIRKVY